MLEGPRNPPPRPTTRKRVRYVRHLDQIEQLTADERKRLKPVADEYVFRANDYYLGLIDWSDAEDPIRQLIIPRDEELVDWGRLDASNEASVTVARGVQHKYTDTVLLLCNEVCGAYCRYCFRKRLFMDENDEVTNDISDGLRYIADHPEVTNVLLTGGDPLLMSTRRLVDIFEALRAIPHVRIIRLGSKMPAFDPWRVLGDEELQAAFQKYSTPEHRIYLMAHFDHPRELTDVAIEGIDACIRKRRRLRQPMPADQGHQRRPVCPRRVVRDLSPTSAARPITCSRDARPPGTSRTKCQSCAAGRSSSRRSGRDRVWRDALATACRTRPAKSRSWQSTRSGFISAITRRRIWTTSAASLIRRRDDEAYWLDQLVPAEPVLA